MNFSQLLSWSYYFSHEGLDTFNYLPQFMTFAAIMVGIGLIISALRSFVIKDKNTKKTLKPFPSIFFWYGIIAFFLTWMRYETIPYLSLRLWWPIFDISLILSLIFAIKSVKQKAAIRVKRATQPKKQSDPYSPTNRKRPNRKR